MTVFFVAQQLPSSSIRYRLENDQMCGLTTGGKENCEWDCISRRILNFNKLYTNIECVRDCFSEDHCVAKVLNDYENSGGICGESFIASQQNWNFTFNYSYLPITENACKYIEVITDQNITILYTTEGIFSEDTLKSLNSDECIFDVYRKSQTIFDTINLIVRSSADIKTFEFWTTFVGRHILGLSEDEIDLLYPLPSNTETKLHPGFR